jgi:Glycosyltransferases involved in cell wall biogenesis
MSNDATGASRALSAVVPCFNEAAGLNELHRRLADACRSVVGDDYELVFVNDGSSDETWTGLQQIAQRDRHVVAVNLARNFGHQLALSAGMSLCRGQRILVVDADLQDPPELLGEMFRLMDAGASVVYGQRTDRFGETAFKRLTARLFYRLLSSLTDVTIPVDTGDFRLMDRQVLDVLNRMPEQHRFIRGMVAWAGFRQVPLVYSRAARYAGSTKYSLRKMLRFALDGITSFSTRPLRLSIYLAFLMLVVAALTFVYVGYSWLFLDSVRGWASLLTLVLVFNGTQLLVIGIAGEYIGRIFMESKSRPLYVISEVFVSQPGFAQVPREVHAGAMSDRASI